MSTWDTSALDQILEKLPVDYPGPGGAVAIVHNGKPIVRHSWGWANADRAIPFMPASLFHMCSITKQFTCGLLLDTCPDPKSLDGDVGSYLPALLEPAPSVQDLCNNQSGLRDYWALTVLHGSPIEGALGEPEALRVVRQARTLQFAPGTRYSYANQNFRILANILQTRTGRSFSELLHERIFNRVGMRKARFIADTSTELEVVGYEGTNASGFWPAENNITWCGDAGLVASLDDMIAWEQYIDATLDDPASLYNLISRPTHFVDGNRAFYGFGLNRYMAHGHEITCHSGGMRGWSSRRVHVRSLRLSIIIMFNHNSDAVQASADILEPILNGNSKQEATNPGLPSSRIEIGSYLDFRTGLLARIDRAINNSDVQLNFGGSVEKLAPTGDEAISRSGTRLRASDGKLQMIRPLDNYSTELTPCYGSNLKDIVGRFKCQEIDADIQIVESGGVIYGRFCGFLGQGVMTIFEPIGGDIWAIPCPRALDYTPPREWTLRVKRGTDGCVAGVEVGCWLARQLYYSKV